MHSREWSICSSLHNHWRWRKSRRISDRVSCYCCCYYFRADQPILNRKCDVAFRNWLFSSSRMTEPQPSYSAFREASFGHGTLDIKNRTHAYFSWHRNQDGYAVEADSVLLINRYWRSSLEESSIATLWETDHFTIFAIDNILACRNKLCPRPCIIIVFKKSFAY